MSKIELEIHDDAVSVVNKLRETTETAVDIAVPDGSVLFENSLNLKLVKKEAERLGKAVSFSTTDEAGQNILNMFDGSTGENVSSDFVAREVSVKDVIGKPAPKKKIKLPGFKFKMPAIPKLNFKLPNIKLGGNKLIPIIGVAVLVLVGGIFFMITRKSEASVKVIVDSQPLIKSVSIRVLRGAETSAEEKILEGIGLNTAVVDSLSTPTTGEKIVGEKAEGKIKIYNRTGSDKDFEEGEEVVYDDYSYFLKDDVTVSALHPEDPTNPASPMIPGEGEVEVVAGIIGDDSNVDSGESMEFDDYSTSEYIAEVIEDIDGGSSEVINIVAEADRTKLYDDLLLDIDAKGLTALTNSVSGDTKYINGSQARILTEETYSHEVGDEADEVTLDINIGYQGLAYSDDTLHDLLEDLLEDLVPEGFELSSEDREVNVEILGNSDSTILDSLEADIQVTLKAFVVPKVDEKELKEDLAGVKITEAQRILNEVRNIKTYELEVKPNIPLWTRMPSNVDKIDLDIERD